MGSVAFAADLPRRAAPAFVAPPPAFTWTGFYIGVNAGYGWGDDRRDICDDGFGGFGFGGGFGCQSLTVMTGGLTSPATAPASVAPVVFTGTPAVFPGFGFDRDRRRNDGFLGGVQAGFNWQLTPGSGFVIGIEGDIQFADFGNRRNDDFFGFGGFGTGGLFTANPVNAAGFAFPIVAGGGFPGLGIALGTGAAGIGTNNVALFNNAFGNGFGDRGSRSDWFATVRGRLGYAFDRFLIYVTGGVAFRDNGDRDDFGFGFGGFGFGGFANTAAVPAAFFVGGAATQANAIAAGVNPTGFGCCFTRHRNDDIGWALGGGVEYAFTNNISVKIEGMWLGFDNDRRHDGFFGGFGVGTNTIVGVSNVGAPIYASNLGFDRRRHDDDIFLVRAGLNFRFGAPPPPAPVVARY